MTNFGWSYPPGVTGNEPQISGVWDMHTVIDSAVTDLGTAKQTIENVAADLEDQLSANRLGELPKVLDERIDKTIELIDILIDSVNDLMPEEPDYDEPMEPTLDDFDRD